MARTVARKDEDTFDKSPNPHGKGSDAAGEKPACQAHNELYNGLGVKAQVEVVNAQAAEDDAEKACRKPALLGITGRRYIVLLETDALGLGGVWFGIAPDRKRMDAVHQVLDLPEDVEVFSMFALGYPAESRPQQNRYDESRIHFVE